MELIGIGNLNKSTSSPVQMISSVDEVVTLFGGIGLEIPFCNLSSISRKVEHPTDMIARF